MFEVLLTNARERMLRYDGSGNDGPMVSALARCLCFKYSNLCAQ